MILASSLDGGKTDTLVNLADDLTGFVRQAVEKGTELDLLERSVFARVLAMGRVAVDLFLAAQGDGDLGTSVRTSTAQTALHLEGTHKGCLQRGDQRRRQTHRLGRRGPDGQGVGRPDGQAPPHAPGTHQHRLVRGDQR